VLRPPGETGAEVVLAQVPDAELVESGVVVVAMGVPLLNVGVEGVTMEVCDTELAAEGDGSWAPCAGSTVGPGGEKLETKSPAM
jgi:hypothetical protein